MERTRLLEVSAQQSTSPPSRYRRLAVFVGLTVGTTALLASVTHSKRNQGGFESPILQADASSLDFRVTNKYTRRNQRPTGTSYPWITAYRLAEPHLASDFVASGLCAGDMCAAYWFIVRGSSFSRKLIGTNVTVVLEAIGTYNVTLTEVGVEKLRGRRC